ncbi:hypothetical protein BOTNAR_0231g00060 [Botryotinia narcissicola]|uniref:Uncharacterized protein n=1 Tax=Botryotinia narcissicola TaxID=278944 RepID=A0A4Z1IAX5_9HELO|nr:hypothetical protein BOTNAR_0231g00060 [Botryotinia narcissicola]
MTHLDLLFIGAGGEDKRGLRYRGTELAGWNETRGLRDANHEYGNRDADECARDMRDIGGH